MGDCIDKRSEMDGGPPKDMSALRDRILSDKDTLSKVLATIARFALENPNEMAITSGRKIARQLSVSPSSVTRFTAALGFQNYPELRKFFQRDLLSRRKAWDKARDCLSDGTSPR